MTLAWKKWVLIGCAAGLTAVVAASLIAGAIWWAATRERPWDTTSVSVVSVSEARQFWSSDFTSGGFYIDFALRNNTDRDLVIPATTKVMKQLVVGSVLDDLPNAKLARDSFVPSGLTAQLEISIEWSCQQIDANGKATEREAAICYADLVSGVSSIVLFDNEHRLKVEVSAPKMKTYTK